MMHRFEDGIFLIPNHDLIVWEFPHDPQLPHLPCVADPNIVKRFFPYEHLPQGLDSPDDIADVNVEIVHYYPEQRCTNCYCIRCEKLQPKKILSIYGKTFKDEESARQVYNRMALLWEAMQAKVGGFIVAKPLGYHAEVKTVWMEAVSGQPFVEALKRSNRKKAITGAANALAALHRSDLTSPVEFDLDQHILELHKKAARLSKAFPVLENPIRSVVNTLQTEAPYPPECPSLTHGDFHARQLLVHEGKIALFDFDEFAMGDPAQDLASFIVDLRFYDFPQEVVQTLAKTFLQAYSSNIPWKISGERIQWYLRSQLVTKAYREMTYRMQNKDLEASIRNLILQAQQSKIRF
ncbi:MAG: phosphotransferase family protein [bacterium]